jgi:hypothetical protein
MTYIEYIAAAFGIVGTLLLALNGKRAGWGFVAFLASNTGWIWFAIAKDLDGLLLQQIAFTATSLLGIWRWFELGPKWQEWTCEHRHDLADMSDRDANGLVHCRCYKCDKLFSAEYGLALPGIFDRNSNAGSVR